MANTATVKLSITLLPDEIQRTFSNLSATYSPANATEGWYYQLTDVSTTSTDLIAAKSFIQKGSGPTQGGVDVGSSIDSIAPASDNVKFLFIRHMSVQGDGTANTADSIYLCLDGGAAAYKLSDTIEIGPGECWFAKLDAPVDEIHAISDQKNRGSGSPQGDIQAQVYAIIDDL